MHRFLFAMLGLSALGCLEKSEGPVGKVDPLSTREGLCAEWAVRACNEEVVEACSKTPGQCKSIQAAWCDKALMEAGLGSGPYLVKSVERCLDQVEKAYADAALDYAEFQAVARLNSEACREIEGSAGAGGAGPTEPLRPGSRCSGLPARSCADGYYCDGAYCIEGARDKEKCCEGPIVSSSGASGAGGTDGAPAGCEREVLCGVGLVCVGELGSQVCAGRSAEADCTRDAECPDGYFCLESKCNKRLPLSSFVPYCAAPEE
jgi:hypothetical protein